MYIQCHIITLICLGMLSKSLGQTLRVATALHVLFHFLSESDALVEAIPDIISEQAIVAAIDFVEVCCQQTAYIAGRGEIQEEIKHIDAGMQCRYIYSCIYIV